MLDRARAQEKRGYRYSYDMLGESARTARDAERYDRAYRAAIAAIGRASAGRGPIEGPGISVKLSALHPRYEFAQRHRVMAELVPRLAATIRGHSVCPRAISRDTAVTAWQAAESELAQ